MGDVYEFSAASPSSVAEAESLIGRIQEHIEAKRDETPDEEAVKLRRLQDRILESLDDAAHIIPELLQNTDDVGGDCTEAVVRLRDDELVIVNDGAGMSEAEVKALGEFAESTKRDLSQIGHFGIGFKTVFSVTDRPHIDSGYVSLEYAKADPEIPRAAFEESEPKFEGTRVRLPFSEDLSATRLNEIHTQLDTIDRLLPFLNNLQTITVERGGETTVYERVDVSDEGSGRVTVHEYENMDDDTPTETWHYQLVTEALDVNSETVKALAKERDLDFEALADRDVDIEVELAFPISDRGNPIGHEDSRLFCYFPTSRDTALPFDIQADFLLKSSREQIRPGHPINDKFLKIAGTLVEKAIRGFQASDIPPSRLITLIPDADADRPDYLTPVTDEAFGAIAELEFVPVESGGTRAPEDLLILPSELHSVVPLEEFCDEYDAADAAHPAKELAPNDFARLAALDSTRVLSVAEALQELAAMDLPSTLSASKVVDLLAAVEEYLDSTYSHKPEYNLTIEALESLPVYPIRGIDEDRQSLDEIEGRVYRPARQGEGTYEPFYDELTLLDDALLSALRLEDVGDDTRAAVGNLFSERLKVEQIRHKDIVDEVVAEAFANPTPHDDETLDEYVEYLREHAKSYANASNTKLRTEAGNYKRPDTLYLPTEYLEGQYGSSLVLGTLTDRDPVSTSYLPQEPEAGDIKAWREFFAGLGVLTHLPVSSTVDRSTRETFENRDEIEAYLNEHNDEGTAVRPDRDTTPYGGQNNQYRWMKHADAQHGLVDYALPEAVEDRFAEASESSENFGRELLKMLDAYWETTDTDGETTDHDWDKPYQERMFRRYCWSIPSNGYALKTEESKCPTSFLALLRETAWLCGPDGNRYRPGHLYRSNSVTKRAAVPLLPEDAADVSPALLDVLNVPDDVGVEQHANGIEQVIAERETREAAEIEREIRSHLHSLTDRINDTTEEELSALTQQLEDCPFIYVERAEPAFRTLDQVVWSKGLGDYLVAINDDYRMFEEFFIDVLDIDTEPTLDGYIEYLGQADAADWSMIEEAWQEVIKRVAYGDSQEHLLDDVATHLSEEGTIPSISETLVPAKEINYVTQRVGMAERLPPALAKQIALPWYDRRISDHSDAVSRLTRLLNATQLEEKIDRDVIAPAHQTSEEVLGERYPLLLNVGYSLLADRDEDDAQERLNEIAGYTLQAAETVTCEYRLGSDSATVDESVYLDQEENHVYVVAGNTVQFELVEAIAAALELTGATRNQFVELVQAIIGKSPELVRTYLDRRELPYHKIELLHPDPGDVSGDGEEANVPDNQSEPERDGSTSLEGHNASGDGTTGEVGTEAGKGESSDSGTDYTGTPSHDPESVSEETQKGSGGQQMEGRVGSHRTEKIIDVAERSDDETPSDGPKTGSGGTLFGETEAAQKTGNVGEKLVLDHLRELLESELGNPEVMTSPDTDSRGYRITGDSNGSAVTVTLKQVPDPQKPRSDLLVEGALLIREGHGFAVARLDSEDQTFVEVKSSKNESRTFWITSAEHKQAQENPRYLIARPVNVGSADARIGTVFDTVPRVEIRTESNSRLEIKSLELDYEGMLVSY